MNELPEELLLPVFRFLWVDDLAALACVSRKVRAASVGDARVVSALLCDVLRRVDQQCEGVDGSGDAAAVLRMVYRVAASWPTRVDLDAALVHFKAPPGLKKLNSDSATRHIVAYQGTRLGDNRCIVANNHFPVVPRLSPASPPSSSSLVRRSTLPFTKVVSPAPGRSVAMSSTVAYYEITIGAAVAPFHDATEPTVVNQNRTANSGIQPCVAIGLALPGFSLRRMPGWCLQSYAWHGDDGLFFHGGGGHGRPFMTDNQPPGFCVGGTRFGAGDTVGCGVLYVTNGRIDPRLFFTKNGHIVGVEFVRAQRLRAHITQPLFPAVGTDCYCPIDFNFGCDGRPFAFDVAQFEKDMPGSFHLSTTPHVRDGNWVQTVSALLGDAATNARSVGAEAFPVYRLMGTDGRPVAESATPTDPSVSTSTRPHVQQLLQEQPMKLRSVSHPLIVDAYAGALRSSRERRGLRSSSSRADALPAVMAHPLTGDASATMPSLFLDDAVIEEVRRMTPPSFDDDNDDDDDGNDDSSYGDSDDEFDDADDDLADDDDMEDDGDEYDDGSVGEVNDYGDYDDDNNNDSSNNNGGDDEYGGPGDHDDDAVEPYIHGL
jgi:hypothetical protein